LKRSDIDFFLGQVDATILQVHATGVGRSCARASKFFVASRALRDLLLCANDLFVAAIVVTIAPAADHLMLGKLSIIGPVAVILMIPTARSAQMGGGINPGVYVYPGATVRGAVERGIPGPDLGTWRYPSGQVHRSRKHSRPLQSSADDGADRHGQTSVLVGARSSAKRRWIKAYRASELAA
jgi:hypothetical protein